MTKNQQEQSDDFELVDSSSTSTQGLAAPIISGAAELVVTANETATNSATPQPLSFQIDHFWTSNNRPWQNPTLTNEFEHKFINPFTRDPNVLMGLSSLDIDCKAPIRVRTHAENVTATGFKANCTSWNDTVHYSSRFSTIAFEKTQNDDWRFGTISADEGHESTSRYVEFSSSFNKNDDVKVAVWISAIECAKDRHCRVKTYVSEVSNKGFRVHLNSWDDTHLHAGTTATWFVYTTAERNITHGRYSTRSNPQRETYGDVGFGSRFQKAPKVFYAFDCLDVDCKTNLRMTVECGRITESGMKTKLLSWADTKLYRAGMTYLAIADTEE